MTATKSLSFVQRIKVGVIAALGYPLIALLASTWRWNVQGYEHYEAIRSTGHQPIFAFWHGRILPATYFWRHRGIVVMTSENFDGEWIARIIKRFGFGTARGSTSHGGARALVYLRRDIRHGRPAAFTVDGPRGPFRSVQPGAVWLASLTGSPILPFHMESDRFWLTNSWDRTQIPRPFSRIFVTIGKPIDVTSSGLDESGLECFRNELEQSLTELSSEAVDLVSTARQASKT